MIPLPDVYEVPEIGTSEREAQEQECLARACELLHEHDGRVCEALHYLEDELRVTPDNPHSYARLYESQARTYARALVSHVEQCWATAILR